MDPPPKTGAEEKTSEGLIEVEIEVPKWKSVVSCKDEEKQNVGVEVGIRCSTSTSAQTPH